MDKDVAYIEGIEEPEELIWSCPCAPLETGCAHPDNCHCDERTSNGAWELLTRVHADDVVIGGGDG